MVNTARDAQGCVFPGRGDSQRRVLAKVERLRNVGVDLGIVLGFGSNKGNLLGNTWIEAEKQIGMDRGKPRKTHGDCTECAREAR